MFPPVEQATPEGLLAIGGDLSSERLLEAYRRGIFPWYSAGQPILWWSPDPRAVLYLDRFKVSRSLRKQLRRGVYDVTMDTCFEEVVAHCAAPRVKDPVAGTWITREMAKAYQRLHAMGYAHSVETWHDGRLVGGLYGLSLGRGFFGESMFSKMTDASKVALAALVDHLKRWGYGFVDCQLPSPHILSLGAIEVPRSRFLRELADALEVPDQVGRWTLAAPDARDNN
jgi:leucyl/phenylalanyl-tRNA--protein transferase